MKFVSALVVYLLMGAVLAWGILETFKGSFWLLGIGFLGYMAILIKVGCLPASDEHH